jgi:hypothetical protein
MPNDPDQQPDPLEKSLGDQATGTDASHVDKQTKRELPIFVYESELKEF